MEITSKCPYCGIEMEKGFVIVYRGIIWDNKRPGFWYSLIGKKYLAGSFWSGRVVPTGFRCRECEIVIFSTKPDIHTYHGIKGKCPYCQAIYYYSEEKIDENGTVICQNCAESFLLDRDSHEAHHEHEL
jgi:uncharacterized Zn-finger protein